MKVVSLSFILSLMISFSSIAQKVLPISDQSVSKLTTNDHRTHINLAGVNYFFSNGGNGATDPQNGGTLGFYYPGNTPNTVVYQDGFVWSGDVVLPNGSLALHSGGGNYVAGLQAGKIVVNGSVNNGNYTAPVADDPAKPENRIYGIYKNWKNLNDEDTRKAVFQSDYDNWPIDQGAPVDKDGKPQFMGDYTYFYVSNDMDSARSAQLYGSPSTGIEVQTTLWGFNRLKELCNVVFIKKKIINKSGLNIQDFYASIWSDPDLGFSGDDLLGVDTTLKLAYCYNGDENDAVYSTPPAVGYLFLSDVNQSSFAYYFSGPNFLMDPPLNRYWGTIVLNWYQQGLDATGSPLRKNDNVTPTRFMVAGDPVSGTGDLDGILYAKDDRRLLYSVGPYQLNKGDTLEITYAALIGQGYSNINSVAKLKLLAKEVQLLYDHHFSNVTTYPESPNYINLSANSSDQKVTLNWQSSASQLEQYHSNKVVFEGYKIYQYDNKGESYLVAYFDKNNSITNIYDSIGVHNGLPEIKLVAAGTNSGLRREITIERDMIKNQSLINGFQYTYGVSAVFVAVDTVNGSEVVSTKYPTHFEVPVTNNITVTPQWNCNHFV